MEVGLLTALHDTTSPGPGESAVNSKNADIAVKTDVFVTLAPPRAVPRALDPFSGAKLIESQGESNGIAPGPQNFYFLFVSVRDIYIERKRDISIYTDKAS